MYYMINKDNDKVEQFLKDNEIKYTVRSYAGELYAEALAGDVLDCFEEEIPDTVDKRYVISKAAERFLQSDYIIEEELEEMSSAILEVLKETAPIKINTDHLSYNKKEILK